VTKKPTYREIPTDLTEQQFNQFFCAHLSSPTRGRKPKLSNFKILRYINPQDARRILSEMGCANLYKNVPLIIKKATGLGPPLPSAADRNWVRKMFGQVNAVIAEHLMNNGDNHDSYLYYIYKLYDLRFARRDYAARRLLFYIYLQSLCFVNIGSCLLDSRNY